MSASWALATADPYINREVLVFEKVSRMNFPHQPAICHRSCYPKVLRKDTKSWGFGFAVAWLA